MDFDYRCLCEKALDLFQRTDLNFKVLLRSFGSDLVVEKRALFCRDVKANLSNRRSLESKLKKMKGRLWHENKEIKEHSADEQVTVTDMTTTRRLLKKVKEKLADLDLARASMDREEVVVDKGLLEQWIAWVQEMERRCLTGAEELERASDAVVGKKKALFKGMAQRLTGSASYYFTLRANVLKLCKGTQAACIRAITHRRKGSGSVESEYVQEANGLMIDYKVFIDNQKKFAEEFRRSAVRLGLI